MRYSRGNLYKNGQVTYVSDRSTLIKIGLVLSGLLLGILLTLWFGGAPSSMLRPGSVERVELGSQPAPGYIIVPESDVPTTYLDALSLNAVFKDVSARVKPAVVFIEVLSRAPGASFYDQFTGGGLRSTSLGSGVIVSGEGYIVTNNHVIDDASKIQVTLADKRQFEARVVGTDPTTDLAVIKIDAKSEIPVIALGDASKIEVGEWVLAVGNPFRLTSTVTAGIISALGRNVDVIDNQLGIESFIQTDAAINPGNSGGALVNLRGELVGIATAIATESGSYQGYGFAVPVDLMERVVRDLIRFGEVRRGYLGVSISNITANVAEQLGLDRVRGVLLGAVEPGLAGYVGGLRDGDVLLAIDGRAMSEPNELQSAIALFSPGDAVPVEIWRDGRELEYTIVLKGREDPGYANWLSGLNRQIEPPRQIRPDIEVPDNFITQFEDWGVGLSDLDSRLRRRFAIAHGVYVAVVTRGSIFERAGLSRGMIITHLNEAPMFNVQATLRILNDEDEILVRAVRPDGAVLFFEITKTAP